MQLYDDPTTVAAPPALPAAGAPGYFTDGVPGSVGRTLIRAWWLNQVAEELVNIVTAAGIAPSRATNNQVLTAIQTLTAVPAASHTVAGKVELATAAEVLAGTDDTMAATSLGVAGAIQAAITALVDGAPIALSNLHELAAAINNDPTFAADIQATIALKAPLAAPALTQSGAAYPTTPTPPAGDATTKIANMAALAALQAALTPQGNWSSAAGPWWEWNPATQHGRVWGNYIAAIATEGEITVNFPVNIGTFKTGRAGTLNSSGNNAGSAVAQVSSGTATTLTVMINDNQGGNVAYATGFWWEAEFDCPTTPVAI